MPQTPWGIEPHTRAEPAKKSWWSTLGSKRGKAKTMTKTRDKATIEERARELV